MKGGFVVAQTYGGLVLTDYEEELRQNMVKRSMYSIVPEYIDSSLILPLESSKNLTMEIFNAILFVKEIYTPDIFPSVFNVSMDYIDNLKTVKSQVIADVQSRIDELNLIKNMTNKVIANISSTITTMCTVSFNRLLYGKRFKENDPKIYFN